MSINSTTPFPQGEKKERFFFFFWGGAHTFTQMFAQQYMFITLALDVNLIETNTSRKYSCPFDPPVADIILNLNQGHRN